MDPVKCIAGSPFTQMLPFYDARVVNLNGQFERALYDDLQCA